MVELLGIGQFRQIKFNFQITLHLKSACDNAKTHMSINRDFSKSQFNTDSTIKTHSGEEISKAHNNKVDACQIKLYGETYPVIKMIKI